MIRSSRHGIPDTHFFLLRHGPSPGAHGGTRGTGTHGIITGHTGAMTRIGITIITTITMEYGITAGMDEMFTTARGIRQALSAPEALQWAGAEVRPDLRCPGIWLQEHPAVQQCPGALHQG